MKQKKVRYKEKKDEDMKVEVDILDSSVLSLREEDKERKKVTHVFASLTMNMVDLMHDYILEMVDDRVPSPTTVSSLA